eukprot:scaffold1492_cov144-Ochromonas_danica.AAC.4
MKKIVTLEPPPFPIRHQTSSPRTENFPRSSSSVPKESTLTETKMSLRESGTKITLLKCFWRVAALPVLTKARHDRVVSILQNFLHKEFRMLGSYTEQQVHSRNMVLITRAAAN